MIFLQEKLLDGSNEDKGIKRTNMNGWHSHTDMHKIPVFKPLVE